MGGKNKKKSKTTVKIDLNAEPVVVKTPVTQEIVENKVESPKTDEQEFHKSSTFTTDMSTNEDITADQTNIQNKTDTWDKIGESGTQSFIKAGDITNQNLNNEDKSP